MSRKKKYTFYKCRDCENDFLAKPKQGKKPFCPTCGEQFYVENMMPVWIERPFQYKRHWTEEEDELIILGRQMGHTYQRISESLQGRSMKAAQKRFISCRKRGILLNRINEWRQKRKRIKQTKQLAKRMLVINEHQRIDALYDRHPVQREEGKEPIK